MLNLIKLENRIVLDGAAVGEVLDHDAHHDALTQGENRDVPDSGNNSANVAGAAALLADPSFSSDHGLDIVVVSDSLPNYQDIANAATPGSHVLIYNETDESAKEVVNQIVTYAHEQGKSIHSRFNPVLWRERVLSSGK